MRTRAAQWSLMLLCFSMAGAMGGGLYEHMVLISWLFRGWKDLKM